MYEKHHQDWEDEVSQKAQELEEEMQDQEEDAQITHKKTIDTAELYENLNVQLNNKHHTDEFNARVEAYEK